MPVHVYCIIIIITTFCCYFCYCVLVHREHVCVMNSLPIKLILIWPKFQQYYFTLWAIDATRNAFTWMYVMFDLPSCMSLRIVLKKNNIK